MTLVQLQEPNRETLSNRARILKDLAGMVDARGLIVDEDGRRAFETDALTAYRQMPLAAVLPTTTEQVSAVLAYCHKNNIRVVARGAGTSLAGGALPTSDSIVLGISRMNQVLDINYANRTVKVQAGITNIAITQAVAPEGFFYAPDPSSQLACTIAGNIAMNSGGAHCLKYGVTTNNILGFTLVLADGQIVELGGEYMDGPGYDFLGLFCGSEGQLGVITEASLRILPTPVGARPMLMGFASLEQAGECVAAIIGAGIIPVALEFMDRPAIKICEDFAHAGYPLDAEALLIVEVEGTEDEIEALLDRIKAIGQNFNPLAMRISESNEASAAIWKGRKSAFGAMGRISDYMCMDGTIPLGTLPQALSEISRICQSYGLGVANIFHAGDGNLHPLIMYNANDPQEAMKVEQCGADILKLCVDLGGCLTGEHGVGIEKRDLMGHQFTPTDLNQQMAVKTALDPKWLLNPSKVFPLEGRPVLVH